jgi:tetratricopeptide (TPR) repeat protein
MTRSKHLKAGLALSLVVIGALGAIGSLWWTSTRPSIDFLPEMAPSAWIMYPMVPITPPHPRLELPTTFRNTFAIGAVPPEALLRIAGFHGYKLSINGASPDRPLRTGKNWKQPDVYDVTAQLQPGANRIEVTVFNSTGPAALWLALDAGPIQVNSGELWDASYAGANWRKVVPASAIRAFNSNVLTPRPLDSLRTRWPVLLGFTLLSIVISCLLVALNSPRSRIPPAMEGNWYYKNLPFIILAGSWLFLFAHNVTLLPGLSGYDAEDHINYVRYIQDHNSLPLASQGWEMFQPPLYYILSTVWLKLLHLSAADEGGIAALRFLGLAVGIAHLLIIWKTLRLLFPAERSKTGWGLVFAACLPPMLFLSQYVTNEAFAAMMVSACVWLTLLLLKQERLPWKSCAALGVCLGAALLSKSTAVLVLPLVFAALFWRWLENRRLSLVQWIARMGVIASLCILVGGWHYARMWIHYGNPLIGNWDPKLFSWWQDNGYRTSSFYLRFGNVLLHPWASTFEGYWDAFYATLWGDGLLGGRADFFVRPPWNYQLMAVGYWLALVPTVAVLAGLIAAVVNFIRRPTAEWFLLLGFSGLLMWALAYMSLVIPAHVKAFYMLSALVSFGAFGALGADLFARRWTLLRHIACILLGLWAINSFACFWISRSSTIAVIRRADQLVENKRDDDARDCLKQGLRSDPSNADLQFWLAYTSANSGHEDEAIKIAGKLAREHPDDNRGLHVLVSAYSHLNQWDRAIAVAHEIVTSTAGFDPRWQGLISFVIVQAHPDESIGLIRQALATDPFDPELRIELGIALVLKDQEHLDLSGWADVSNGLEAEAATQFRYACLITPKSVGLLDKLAWNLATDPSPSARNAAVALKLAQHACALTRCSPTGSTQMSRMGITTVVTLAAAYAEASRYPEALKAAEQAHAAALALGNSGGAAGIQKLVDLFGNRQPYRTAPQGPRLQR